MTGDSMFSIRDEFLRLLGQEPSGWKRADVSDFEQKALKSAENGSRYELSLTLPISTFPKERKLDDFLKLIVGRDSCTLSFANKSAGPYEGTTLKVKQTTVKEEYDRFIDYFKSGDKITAALTVTKSVKDGFCSVYEWDAFAECLLQVSADKNSPGFLPEYLNSLFEKYPEGMNFHVLDREADFATESIAFVNFERDRVRFENRKEALLRYNDASLFMGRTENYLLPGDFHANASRRSLPGQSGQDVKNLIDRYETVYSLMYLADASWFEERNLVVQLVKGGKEFKLPITEIKNNPDAYKLAVWAFESKSALERASIARDTMAFYCRDALGIMNIDPGIAASAKSSYKLYKRKNIDKYIDLKKGLSDSILGSVKQVQDLIGSLVGSFEKNFVAVITVIISEVLAKHISWKDFSTGQFRTPDFISVVRIFTVASFVYLIASIISIYFKWNYYEEQYGLLREHYKELLPGEELDKAFDNDRLITSAKRRLQRYVIYISVLWSVLNMFVLFKSEITGSAIWPYALVSVIGVAAALLASFFMRDSK